MRLFANALLSYKNALIIILILNISIFHSVSSIISAMGSNLGPNDSPSLMKGIVIDHYGNDKVIRGKVEDVAKQTVSSISHPLAGNES
ncbi:MAG: hypothetical protein ACFE8U_16115, partial [Candidatus Hermodarchaeota archaeon]